MELRKFYARVLPKAWASEYDFVNKSLQEAGVEFVTRDLGWGVEWVIPGSQQDRIPKNRRKVPILPTDDKYGHYLTCVTEKHLQFKAYCLLVS